MGVVNVTPDSFSDGGRFLDADIAVAHGLALVAAGADVLDVGGESTRPGAAPVDAAEELRRVLPVVAGLAADAGVPVSIDTTKASVAAGALDAGATIVNDVAAGRADDTMLGVVADAGVGYIAMHMLGDPRSMQEAPHYDDVVDEVGAFLVERLAAARAAGVNEASLVADPGIGFGKTVTHNLDLLARLRELVERVDAPLLVGTSRKRFLGSVLAHVAGVDGTPEPDARDDGTLASVVWALDQGARIVRVHDVRSSARAVRLLDVLDRAVA
jgi:dihydropteroate synthase